MADNEDIFNYIIKEGNKYKSVLDTTDYSGDTYYKQQANMPADFSEEIDLPPMTPEGLDIANQPLGIDESDQEDYFGSFRYFSDKIFGEGAYDAMVNFGQEYGDDVLLFGGGAGAGYAAGRKNVLNKMFPRQAMKQVQYKFRKEGIRLTNKEIMEALSTEGAVKRFGLTAAERAEIIAKLPASNIKSWQKMTTGLRERAKRAPVPSYPGHPSTPKPKPKPLPKTAPFDPAKKGWRPEARKGTDFRRGDYGPGDMTARMPDSQLLKFYQGVMKNLERQVAANPVDALKTQNIYDTFAKLTAEIETKELAKKWAKATAKKGTGG